ncbi:MAG TPA: radical SAM protein, partial [Chthoniobacterales bacterium]|nr:radical SAM protein [Chthoniobacterales bacterium]
MSAPRPYGLLAELTHRCPLHCPYCSNPLELAARAEEMPVADWTRVLREAAELGVMQVGFSGGEPLLYRDLTPLIETSRAEGLYSNLITSGVGLTAERARELRAAGLDTVQISFQAEESELANAVAGANVHEAKLITVRHILDAGFPLGV